MFLSSSGSAQRRISEAERPVAFSSVYERVDRRRRALMRDIVAKYREIEYLREKRLTLIQPVNDA